MAAEIMLDRDQREALRSLLRLTASGYTGGAIDFTRRELRLAVSQLGVVADTMEAIGWREDPGAPNVQRLEVGSELVSLARREAKHLVEALADDELVHDQALDELAVLNAIGGGA